MFFKTFLKELQRRNVIKAGITYIAVSWVILQAAELIFPIFNISTSVLKTLLIILILVFPVWLVFAWIYEYTPQGFKKSEELDVGDQIPKKIDRRNNALIIGSLMLAVLLLLADRYWGFTASSTDNSNEKSIAVLPFENLNRDPDKEYVSDGITDALINGLSTVKDLKVSSRTSSSKFKDSDQTVEDIARILNITHIIEGSVLERGNKIRLAANLIDIGQNKSIWTFNKVYDLKDIFQLQNDFTLNIVENVGIQLGSGSAGQIKNAKEVDPEAYRMFMRGMDYLNNIASKFDYNIRQALLYFERAIEIDPNFGLAYAYAGRCYSAGGRLSDNVTRLETWIRAKQYAEQALELDRQLDLAYTVIAWLKIYFEWDWPGAEEAILDAISINPNSDLAFHHYTHLLMIQGRFDEGLRTGQRCRDLSPLDRYYIAHEIWDLYVAGKYQEALQIGMEITASDPGNAAAWNYLAVVLDYFKKYDEILELADLRYIHYARAHIYQGDYANGRKLLNQAIESSYGNESAMSIAVIYIALNEYDTAFEWLDKAARERHYAFPDIRFDHRFIEIREDPRWIDLMKRMKLE